MAAKRRIPAVQGRGWERLEIANSGHPARLDVALNRRETYPESCVLSADCRLEYLGDLVGGVIVGAAGPS